MAIFTLSQWYPTVHGSDAQCISNDGPEDYSHIFLLTAPKRSVIFVDDKGRTRNGQRIIVPHKEVTAADIRWSDLPGWARNYAACSANGEWSSFHEKPEIGPNDLHWHSFNRSAVIPSDFAPRRAISDFRGSLLVNPDLAKRSKKK